MGSHLNDRVILSTAGDSSRQRSGSVVVLARFASFARVSLFQFLASARGRPLPDITVSTAAQ